MKSTLIVMTCFIFWGTASLARGQDDASGTTLNAARDLEIEKLNLEIERLKLENQRLQLQIQSLQMGASVVKPEEKSGEQKSPKQGEKRIAEDMASKAEDLAKQNASNDTLVVLDFTNGEIWYKGQRNRIDDFYEMCKDQKWEAKADFLKYDINGDSLERYRHQNMYLDRYENKTKGVFAMDAPQNPGDFSFVTPEGVASDSSFTEIRNRFETEYFTFDKARDEKGMRVSRFKHKNGFLSFDDVLEFWFNKQDKLQEVKWGILDKK